jgi:hypothetical protein
MAETNGSGRLDRIDATLDKLAERQKEFAIIQERDREDFARDHRQLMTWEVLMQDRMEKADIARQQDREDSARERRRLDQLWENTDRRIADLVTAIGLLIQK